MNTENQEQKNQLQIDFETTVAEKNKIIAQLEKERDAAISAQMKKEAEIDNLKAEKKSALDKAERFENKYLRNTELKARSNKQEQDLLTKLFSE